MTTKKIELVVATSEKPADIYMGPADVFVFDMGRAGGAVEDWVRWNLVNVEE